MYGYVRPLKPELKIKHYEQYRAVYCGLCHALRKDYGVLSRFTVSYDMTLPALLLSNGGQALCYRRCPVSPFKKKCVSCGGGVERVAALTIILAYYKAADIIADGGFFKKISGFFLKLCLRRKHKKASRSLPAFDSLAGKNLFALSEAEKAVPSEGGDTGLLDRCAGFFAEITAGFAELWSGEREKRIYREFFYHIGRAVYILDAADDYEEDIAGNRFNAIASRYAIRDKKLPEIVKTEISDTILMSLASAAAAFELMDENPNTPIIENIVYLGMRGALNDVMTVSKKERKKRKKITSRKGNVS